MALPSELSFVANSAGTDAIGTPFTVARTPVVSAQTIVAGSTGNAYPARVGAPPPPALRRGRPTHLLLIQINVWPRQQQDTIGHDVKADRLSLPSSRWVAGLSVPCREPNARSQTNATPPTVPASRRAAGIPAPAQERSHAG